MCSLPTLVRLQRLELCLGRSGTRRSLSARVLIYANIVASMRGCRQLCSMPSCRIFDSSGLQSRTGLHRLGTTNEPTANGNTLLLMWTNENSIYQRGLIDRWSGTVSAERSFVKERCSRHVPTFVPAFDCRRDMCADKQLRGMCRPQKLYPSLSQVRTKLFLHHEAPRGGWSRR